MSSPLTVTALVSPTLTVTFELPSSRMRSKSPTVRSSVFAIPDPRTVSWWWSWSPSWSAYPLLAIYFLHPTLFEPKNETIQSSL